VKSGGIEGIAAAEALRLVGRDRGKFKLVLGLYALSFKEGEVGKATRAAYFFARHLDDVLDGDRNVTVDPIDYARSLQKQVAVNKFDNTLKIGRLAQFALPIIEKVAQPADDPRGEMIRLIDALVFDYERRQQRRPLSEHQLRTYYQDVLDPGLNILLTGLGSKIRMCDVSEYSPNLGRLYSVRDLEDDWRSGIINVPSETLVDAKVSGWDSYDGMRGSVVVDEWVNREVHEAVTGLQETQQTISGHAERWPRKILNGLADSAIKAVAIR
jgi:hypothetical protein